MAPRPTATAGQMLAFGRSASSGALTASHIQPPSPASRRALSGSATTSSHDASFSLVTDWLQSDVSQLRSKSSTLRACWDAASTSDAGSRRCFVCGDVVPLLAQHSAASATSSQRSQEHSRNTTAGNILVCTSCSADSETLLIGTNRSRCSAPADEHHRHVLCGDSSPGAFASFAESARSRAVTAKRPPTRRVLPDAGSFASSNVCSACGKLVRNTGSPAGKLCSSCSAAAGSVAGGRVRKPTPLWLLDELLEAGTFS